MPVCRKLAEHKVTRAPRDRVRSEATSERSGAPGRARGPSYLFDKDVPQTLKDRADRAAAPRGIA